MNLNTFGFIYDIDFDGKNGQQVSSLILKHNSEYCLWLSIKAENQDEEDAENVVMNAHDAREIGEQLIFLAETIEKYSEEN